MLTRIPPLSHFVCRTALPLAGAALALAPLIGIGYSAPEPPRGAASAAPITIRPLDPVEARSVSYSRQIHPLLANKCVDCHSGKDAAAKLDLSSYAAMVKGGKHGPPLLPGKPDESELVAYVRGLKQPRMPLNRDPLTVDEVHLLREWIAAGAKNDATGLANQAGDADPLSAPPDNRPVEDESNLTVAQIRTKHLARLPGPPPVPVAYAPVYNQVDAFIAAKWQAKHFPVPPLCDDATFVRRAYLDVIGIIPTPQEAQQFIADRTPNKRTKLIDQLLARNDDYVANWMPWWEEALTSNGKHQGGVGTRPNLRPWLTENLKSNRPYDEMVAELIDPTAPGATAKLAANWIRNGDHVETTQTAANVAQVFEGTALKCANCHNNFLNAEWPQKKFLSFASYFAPKDLEVIRCEVHEGEFVKPAFIFRQPAARQPVPQDLNGRLKLVSRLIVDPENPRFAPCIVNRLWKRYFGLGLVEPADDFRADRAASHPELLAWLADDFMRHDYDLKHTIRLILTSRTYQLKFNPKLADTFNVAKPDLPRYYRSPGLRRLAAEQLLDSISVAVGEPLHRLYLEDASTELTRALGKPSTRNEVTTARPGDVAVVQALELLNGEEFNSRVAAGKLAQELAQEMELTQVISRAYWSVLSRAPTPAEIAAARRFLSAGQDTAAGPPNTQATIPVASAPPVARDAVVDMLWSLMASPEFQYVR